MIRDQKYLLLSLSFQEEITEDLKKKGKLIIMRMIIKIADVSTTSREWSLSKEWAERLSKELANQVSLLSSSLLILMTKWFWKCDEEIAKGLVVTMPEFCRDKYDFAKSQESFIRCVVMKMFESFNGKFEVFKLTDILNQFFCRCF